MLRRTLLWVAPLEQNAFYFFYFVIFLLECITYEGFFLLVAPSTIGSCFACFHFEEKKCNNKSRKKDWRKQKKMMKKLNEKRKMLNERKEKEKGKRKKEKRKRKGKRKKGKTSKSKRKITLLLISKSTNVSLSASDLWVDVALIMKVRNAGGQTTSFLLLDFPHI